MTWIAKPIKPARQSTSQPKPIAPKGNEAAEEQASAKRDHLTRDVGASIAKFIKPAKVKW